MSGQLEMWSQVPTTTVHQSRLQVFQPTRRPTDTIRRVETPWGFAVITGRLGQTHADLIESFCKCAEDFRVDNEGRLHLLVDPQAVRKSMAGGVGHDRYPLNRIESLTVDMMRAVIELNAPSQKIRILGGIIDKVEESPMKRGSKNGQERHMWRVVLADTFAMLLQQDIHLNYNPAPIARLKTGIGQAVTRHILTHKDEPNGGWKVDTLLEMVGVNMANNAQVRQRRLDLKKDSEGLEELGIVLDGERLYKKSD